MPKAVSSKIKFYFALSFQVTALGGGHWKKAWLWLLKHFNTLCLVPVALCLNT